MKWAFVFFSFCSGAFGSEGHLGGVEEREAGGVRIRGGEGRTKEELRSWMVAKRRERLAQFVAERDRLRKREKRPFHPPPKVHYTLTYYCLHINHSNILVHSLSYMYACNSEILMRYRHAAP